MNYKSSEDYDTAVGAIRGEEIKEITELENKYVGLIKLEDFRDLPDKLKGDFHFIMSKVDEVRYRKGKPPMSKDNYVILNLDDEIDLWELNRLINKVRYTKVKFIVSDIAIALVNAILKAKEEK